MIPDQDALDVERAAGEGMIDREGHTPFRSPREGGTIEARPSKEPSDPMLIGRWTPRDGDTKAEAFYVDTGGDTVEGTYIYANGRTRRGRMLRTTLHRDWLRDTAR
jgi:hypothetical protein